ncbi:MAG: sulfite exporter TauE/SafE family protein [Sediminibacterium sp.]
MDSTLIILCIVAFFAGFIDAIVGGGGLIQTPTGLILLPNEPVARVIGSLKIPAFTGTFFAARNYLKLVKIPFSRLILFTSIAFISAFIGSFCLTKMSNQFMKPVLIVVLLVIALYTYFKKDLGLKAAFNEVSFPWYKGVAICIGLGFYDGFIGPGAGALLVLAFIGSLGFDFLQANAHAKVVNLATNLGSIFLFILKGSILWSIAIPMAFCNAFGGIIGSKMAINKGNKFIRVLFLIVIIGTLCRLGYDVFLH